MSDIKVRNGALKLKGDEAMLAKKAKKKAKKEKKKAKKRKLEVETKKPEVLDEETHGGWYKVSYYIFLASAWMQLFEYVGKFGAVFFLFCLNLYPSWSF